MSTQVGSFAMAQATPSTQPQTDAALANRAAEDQKKEISKSPDTCSNSSGFSWLACKIVANTVAAFFSITIALAGSFMSITGAAFDWLIYHLVVNMGGWMKDIGLIVAVEHVWSVFRDLGNIMLVGMFIFISLRTILGIDSNSNKQLVMNVIIVALLMNFSLFFVKAAFDVTNFFAFQFYKSISSIQVTTNGKTEQKDVGVAARFGTLSGAGSLTPDGNSPVTRLFEAAQKSQQASAEKTGKTDKWNWGIAGLAVQGTGITIMYLGAGAVFAYGSFLMIVRTLMVILLMITSSVAFITYVLPSQNIRKYFEQWRDGLIQNAIFGPLLMILMWASIMLSDALVGVGSDGVKKSGRHHIIYKLPTRYRFYVRLDAYRKFYRIQF
jgi:hypothetical protein